MKRTRTIRVDYLARVEGEGSLFLKINEGKLEEVQLKIFEPPRFFEALLQGRHFTEAPDITARICGICPVAYQMSSVHAMEQACGVQLEDPLRQLRRLLYCGEWIESHTLHIYMLHAPDFLGYESAIHMAKDHPELVKQGLALKKIGNGIVNLVGGREIHPINVRVGGFYRIPSRQQFQELKEELKKARDHAVATARWVAGLDFPEFQRSYLFVSLFHPQEYPFNEGRLVSNRGLDLAVDDYEAHFHENHQERSTALHSELDGSNYFVGPLARINNCFDQLSPLAREVAVEIGLKPGETNPFKSILARAVETVYACDEAIRIIEDFTQPNAPFVDCIPRDATGYACTEAPRGILYHRYQIGADGLIKTAKIVPPTSQNQSTIEDDLRAFVASILDRPDEKIQWLSEQAIRNYDPCISCSTHFLKLKVERL